MPTEPTPLETHVDWDAQAVADPATWTVTLSDDHVAELEAAVAHARSRHDEILDATVEDFPLPTLAGVLADVERELIEGRGFVRLRRIPVERVGHETATWMYWGMGMHLGYPWPQNARGHVLGDVVDEGRNPDDPNARGYQMGGMALPFHCDGSDLVGLLCLRAGREGGTSLVSNAVRAHNRLVAERPDLAAELYEPLPYDFRGEQPEGAQGWYRMPCFVEHGARLFVRMIRPYVYASQRHDDAPRLTDAQVAAIDAFDELVDDPSNRVEMDFEVGDVQLINNYHVLHGRTAYVDWDEPGRKRLLKRLWLETSSFDESERPVWFRNRADLWGSRGRTRAS